MTTPALNLTRGTTVWSVKLNWGLVSGSAYKALYGANGELGVPAVLTVRRAGTEYRCADCRGVIERGALHGSNIAGHYCLSCVTTTEPEAQFKTKAA